MNQILYTGGKNNKGKMKDTQKIIIFFIIFLIVFAICLIGVGTNLLRKVKNEDNNNSVSTNTTLENPEPLPEASMIEIMFDSQQLGEVIVMVSSTKNIESISYWWDGEEPKLIELDVTEQIKEYETVLTAKYGSNTLNVEVTDEEGYVQNANKIVIGDSKPQIEIGTDDSNNYVIKAKDDEKIDRVTIKINGQVEEIEVNAKTFEHTISIPEGNPTIDVTVYNLNGLYENKQVQVPEITIGTDGSKNYVINAKDNEEIDRVIIKLNDQTEEIDVNAATFEYTVPIPQGYSLIEVTVYDKDGLYVIKKGRISNFGG